MSWGERAVQKRYECFVTRLSSMKLCKITSGRFECVEPTWGAEEEGWWWVVHSRGEKRIKDGGGRDLQVLC